MKSLYLSIVYCLLLTTEFCQGSQVDSEKNAWRYSFPLMTALGLRNKPVDQRTESITKSDSGEWTGIEIDGNESIILIEQNSPKELFDSQSTLKKVPSSQDLGSEKPSTPITNSPLQTNRKSYDKLITASQESSIDSSGLTDKQAVQIVCMDIDRDESANKPNQEETSMSPSAFKLFYSNCCNCFETGAKVKKKSNS